MTEPGSETRSSDLQLSALQHMAGIIHHTPGDAWLSGSSHDSAFSAWQAARSLELLCVTILPFAEWDIKIFTWGMGHGVPSINVCDLL